MSKRESKSESGKEAPNCKYREVGEGSDPRQWIPAAKPGKGGKAVVENAVCPEEKSQESK